MTPSPPPPPPPPPSNGEEEDAAADTWAATANLYDRKAARLTERHGYDLVGLIETDLSQADITILEIGCGTGAFAQAYLQYFPKGVPGQTLILTDLSTAMLEKTRTNLSPYLVNNNEKNEFATKIVIQEEDGTKLTGIDDDSIDIVVSLFGVFLIPDQEATFRSIRRVLRQNVENQQQQPSLFANASWVFNVSDAITANGLGGPSLQDVFTTPTRTIDPSRSLLLSNNNSMMYWADRTVITETLGARLFPKDDNDDDSTTTATVVVHRASHTSVWQWPILWQMLVNNPMMSILKEASPDNVQRAQTATRALVFSSSTTNDNDDDEPVVLSSISNLTICRRRRRS